MGQSSLQSIRRPNECLSVIITSNQKRQFAHSCERGHDKFSSVDHNHNTLSSFEYIAVPSDNTSQVRIICVCFFFLIILMLLLMSSNGKRWQSISFDCRCTHTNAPFCVSWHDIITQIRKSSIDFYVLYYILQKKHQFCTVVILFCTFEKTVQQEHLLVVCLLIFITLSSTLSTMAFTF